LIDVFVAQQPCAGLGRFTAEVSRLHADTFTVRRTSLDKGSVCR